MVSNYTDWLIWRLNEVQDGIDHLDRVKNDVSKQTLDELKNNISHRIDDLKNDVSNWIDNLKD